MSWRQEKLPDWMLEDIETKRLYGDKCVNERELNMKNIINKFRNILSIIMLLVAIVGLLYIFVIRFTQLEYNDTYFFVVHIKEFLVIFALSLGSIFMHGES